MAYISNEDRRQQIIEAATKVIRAHGVVNATTRRIAEAASAPLGSLHYCFRNKDELFEEVAKKLGAIGRSTFEACVTPGMGVADATAAILTVSSRWTPSIVNDTVAEVEFHLASLRSKRHRNIPKKIYSDWIRFFARLLERAQAPNDPAADLETIAKLIITHQDGMLLMDKFLGSRSKTEISVAYARVMAEAIRRGDFALGDGSPPTVAD
jgi:TetR/AcrR family transcriptional regulator, regulator of biofilm formation and stress response